jgi:predicted AAA+ superfamily ATPase
MWYERQIEQSWPAEATLPVRSLVGVRQCGKSSVLHHLAGEGRTRVTLDDPAACELARSDPMLFLETWRPPVLIDECHLAPGLFPAIKAWVDRDRLSRGGAPVRVRDPFWLTGSHRLVLDAGARESLAGRVTHTTLHPLSVAELATASSYSLPDVLLRGGFPELYLPGAPAPTRYFNDYISTAVERDAALGSGVEKLSAFLRMTRLLAGRVANLLNASELGRDAGVRSSTIEDWITALERTGLLYRVEPFHSNRASRIVKAAKPMFCDVGLAARLQGWSSAEPLMLSPAIGALFENLVFLELIKTRDHLRLDLGVMHLRTRDGDEVDFVVEASDNRFLLIEVKLSRSAADAYRRPPFVHRVLGDVPFWVVTSGDGPVVRRPGLHVVPLPHLADELVAFAGLVPA